MSMRLPALTVIEASAGTGKTFSLVTRLLRLIFDGVEPERIVALTFSRMAAGEIFNSFIERLSKAADDPKVAAAESQRLGRNLSAADFGAMLRKVIAHQHLSLIGTLDSFLMRIVRMIPLELGFGGEVSVMSDYRSPVERDRLVADMLMLDSEDAKEVFREAFRLVTGTAGSNGFWRRFTEFVSGWHSRYRDLSDATAWGTSAAIWGGKPPGDLDVSMSGIRSMAEGLESYRDARGGGTFIDAVSRFSGTVPEKLPKCMEHDPLAELVLHRMRMWRIAHSLEVTQGIFRLMRTYDAAYDAKVRSRGNITFEDLPRLVNSLAEGVRLPLEYRLDAKFEHWALDEFQDTSRGQWKALENLISESSQPGMGRSVLIVGDRKQSIYEWRGGDVKILSEQVVRARQGGNSLEALDESHRYLQSISDAVNIVFGESTIRGAFDMDTAPAGAVWECRPHRSHDTDGEGFVEVIQAEKQSGQAKISDFFEPIENALRAVNPWERGISTAILVRKNTYGEDILAYLKSRGIDRVVFEGDSYISDSPVLSAMVELAWLADHSRDAFSYAHIGLSPIAKAMYPDGLPSADRLSAQLLEDFTRIGMVRKFREVREALKVLPDSWDDFTEARFEDFIKCAAEFEESRDATMRLSDFVEFLKNRTRRDYAEPGVVRIMTMHQSKGLGFDHVIIPFFEPDGLVDRRHVGPLEGKDGEWLLDNPGSDAASEDPTLASAETRRQQTQRYNSLCLAYVAMTRAKKALTIMLHPRNAKKKGSATDSPAKFSDLVRLVGLNTLGDREWYLRKSESKHENEQGRENEQEEDAPHDKPHRARRSEIRKARPSSLFHSGMKGDSLFAESFGKAAKRGVEIHALYSKIEWLDPSKAETAFDRALVRPAGCVALWRERPYEILLGNVWQSGQFDRVVFTDVCGERRATIYDFKTNATRKGEDVGAFSRRMKETYLPQMRMYRSALSALTGIPQDRISTKLLLYETMTEVDCDIMG